MMFTSGMAMAENYTRYSETAYYDDFKVSTGSRVLFEDHFESADNFNNGKSWAISSKLKVSATHGSRASLPTRL